MSSWHTFDTTKLLDSQLAKAVYRHLDHDIQHDGTASLAVSGGRTPRGMFRHLSQCDLDWSKVDIVLVDERCVSPQSTDSNERLVRENLLQNRAAPARFHSMALDPANPEEGIASLRRQLATIKRPFSRVVLGMGGDGHTASWFPEARNLADLLDASNTQELAVTEPLSAPHKRITLTLQAVLNSRGIIVHITGDEKKVILEQATEKGVPIAAVLQQTQTPVEIWWAPCSRRTGLAD